MPSKIMASIVSPRLLVHWICSGVLACEPPCMLVQPAQDACHSSSTAALQGDAICSFFLTAHAHGWDRRRPLPEPAAMGQHHPTLLDAAPAMPGQKRPAEQQLHPRQQLARRFRRQAVASDSEDDKPQLAEQHDDTDLQKRRQWQHSSGTPPNVRAQLSYSSVATCSQNIKTGELQGALGCIQPVDIRCFAYEIDVMSH